MIKEAYVSFEVAKLLKEKGFDIPCYGRYSVRSQEFHLDTTRPCNNGGISQYSAPTHQMAMAWLRENGIHMSIDTVISSSGNIYFNIDTYSETLGWNHPVDFYDSYEEAVEAALKYVLENLNSDMTQEDKEQLSSKDLCKTCKHCWTDFPLPLDRVFYHCEKVDEKYGFKPMDDYVSYPCLECPFNSYVKKKQL